MSDDPSGGAAARFASFAREKGNDVDVLLSIYEARLEEQAHTIDALTRDLRLQHQRVEAHDRRARAAEARCRELEERLKTETLAHYSAVARCAALERGR
jgi:hypothetical protein